MKKLIAKIRAILRNRRVRKIWTRTVSSTACLVVFVTTYALILPAITMESKASCGIEAHQHDESCYEERLICNIPESDGHKHTADCYSTTQKLICNRSEHLHTSDCYDEEGNLTFSQEEHQHGKECYEEIRELICGLEESEGHHHDSSCYEKVLTCEKEVHTHSTACYREDAASVAATEHAAVAATTTTSADDDAIGEAANASGTFDPAETAAEGYVPPLDELDFRQLLNDHTAIYYHKPADSTEDSGQITDWKRVDEDTVLGESDILRVYLAYTIPAGSLNETNATARYRLPGNLHLTDEQMETINQMENGLSGLYLDYDTLQITDTEKHSAYLGAEAVDGFRTPDQTIEDYLSDNNDAGDGEQTAQEIISAVVKADQVYDEDGVYGKKDAYLGTDLVFTFSPYTILKNRNEYDSEGTPVKAGESVSGWFTLDFNMDQVDWDDNAAEITFVSEDNELNTGLVSVTLEKADPTSEETPEEPDPASEESPDTNNSDDEKTFDDNSSTEENKAEAVEETHPAVSFEDSLTVHTGNLSSDTDAGNLPNSSKMTVSVFAEAGTFPDGTTMVLSAVTDMDAVAEAVEGTVDSKTCGFQAVDISFRDKDGNETEPLKPISVTMRSDSIKAATEDSSMAPVVVHVENQSKKTIDETSDLVTTVMETLPSSVDNNDNSEPHSITDSSESISFKADSFSIYAIVYTVDFSYEVNGKEYSFTMKGEDSVSLRALIEYLHVYEKSGDEEKKSIDELMSDITSVEFSNPRLLAVCEVKEDTTLGQLNAANGIVQDYTLTAPEPDLRKYNAKEFKAGDWALISLKPFDTEEFLKIGLASGEEFRIKVTDAQDAQMVGDQVLTVSNPAGTTIDLFDYWINDDLRYTVGRGAWPGGYDGNGWTNDWTYQDIGLLVEGQGTEAGINEGHAFKFTPAYAGTVRDGTTNYKSEDASGRINSYTGDGNTWHWFCPNPNQGIVQSTLSGGYPILTNNTEKGTNGESLAYLFNPKVSHAGKESYPGVDQFLYVDKDGYYTYDSRDYKADYNYDGTFTLTEQTASGSDRGFWPFGTSTYWSGMHINAQFSMPENGKVLNPRGEYKDMQFEFSGDDDTWIYVDGVLIGDGGGIHNRCEIDINFASGDVIINENVVGTLRGFIEAAKSEEIAAFTPEELEKWNAQWNGNTFAAGTYHTFDMFYLERGGDESNLYIKYNLVSTADFTAHKSYSGYDDDDVMQRNQFRFELIGLDGKYRSVWDENANDYVLVQEDTTSEAIMPHASSTGAGTTVSPYYSDDYSVELHDGTTVNSQIYITGNVEDGNVNFGNAQISEQDMHDCDAGNPPAYRYIVREVVPDDAVNADNVTWANATPAQRAAGGFVKDSVVYDNTVYYMAAIVTSWTETDASGTPRTRYGLSKAYYTDDTYTVKRENTPFIDFRNTYQPNLADFEFDKVDANEEPVEGAVFQLFRDSACKTPAKDSNNQNVTSISKANGKVSFEDVRTGIYFMKEISAPEPYDLNPTVYRVTISKQGSHMSVNSDQNNTPVTEVFNLKSTDITVMKKWVDQDGEEVSGAGHPATVQLRRYRYVSTAPAPETHNVTLHFHFPSQWINGSWTENPAKTFEETVTGNSVIIHWKVNGCGFYSDSGKTQRITDGSGDNLIQLPLDQEIELDIWGEFDWGYSNLNNVSITHAVDNSKELRPDDSFPSDAENSKATQVLTDEHHMHAWSFGIGDEFDFPPGDELGQYLYYVVELNDQEQEVAIGENVDEDMKLLSVECDPAMTDGKGITHGLITVTNEVTVAAPTPVDITVLKVDNDNNNIRLGGATFELTKVQSLETINQVSDGRYSESGTTSDADDETKGKLLFTGLTPGYYYLHEAKSPDGYITTTNGWHFQVDENGIVSGAGDFDPDGFFRYVDENSITVTNQKGVELPSTGGPGTHTIYLLGSILILGAGVLLWRRESLLAINST